jgi:hypothetical protein
MKNVFFVAILFVLVACEDTYKETHRYNLPYMVNLQYPVRLDASEILADIQVKPSIQPETAFKIVSNDKYFFVGEKRKGIHVYEKTGEFGANPLCFIECKHMKAFDVADNILYCNNFIDLLVVDVTDPQQAKIKHRDASFFYSGTLSHFGDGTYVLGCKQIRAIVTITETKPPDFSEYDKLYGNIIVKEIPDSIQVDVPFAAFTNIEGDVYTWLNNRLALCTFASGVFEITQTTVNTQYPTYDLRYKDNMIFGIGISGFMYLSYFSNIFEQIQGFQYYGNNEKIALDVVTMKNPVNSFAVASVNSIDCISQSHFSSIPTQGATSLINIDETILALGNQLTLCRYFPQKYQMEVVKQYSDISGLCMIRNNNVLIVANQHDILFYDISDLENITPITSTKSKSTK